VKKINPRAALAVRSRDCLIIFVKYPQAGKVKTRLAKSIGEENAARLYRALVETLLKRTNSDKFQRIIFYSPRGKGKEMRRWLGEDFAFVPQKGKGLGERLSGAFKFAFRNGAKRVIAIGSDSPTLDKKFIAEAFGELKDAQCVIGPALDGGYYLIGLSSWIDGIFKGIQWSTESVLNRTISKLKQLNIKHILLGKSFDIDSYQDIILLRKRLQGAFGINPAGLKRLSCVLEELQGTYLHMRKGS
jgi:rSAM/selenodomain-associated transferase 1